MANDDARTLETYDDAKLHDILRDDVSFTETVVLAIPELASDTAYDLYGHEWIKRYWKKLVMEVQGGGLTSDSALHWAVETSVAGLSAQIASHFGLPETSLPACIALAILIMRAAKNERRKD